MMAEHKLMKCSKPDARCGIKQVLNDIVPPLNLQRAASRMKPGIRFIVSTGWKQASVPARDLGPGGLVSKLH